jgi:hypothetical protein
MNLRQCDDIEKEMVAQEIPNVGRDNYTAGGNDILRSVKKVGYATGPRSPRIYLDRLMRVSDIQL